MFLTRLLIMAVLAGEEVVTLILRLLTLTVVGMLKLLVVTTGLGLFLVS